jgi:hypothetical protein
MVAVCRRGGVDLARMLVAFGYAAACPRFSKDYVAAEKGARRKSAGIWKNGYESEGLLRRAVVPTPSLDPPPWEGSNLGTQQAEDQMQRLLLAAAIVAMAGAAEAQMCGGAPAAGGAQAGTCGMMAQPAQAQSGQSMPGMNMPGMQHGQSQPQPGQGMMQGGMMIGCPMMKQMAAFNERVRQLEDMVSASRPEAPRN